tara:strand:+ start:129 stop:467 length:339 start_codon:yes stop_codon:yes gene_type:complete
MIVVQGNIPLKAEARDRAIKLAMEIEGISKQEVGCLGYQFYVALTDPLELVLFQQWESVEALRKHYQTDHMSRFMKELPDLVSGDIVTRRYAIEPSGDEGSRIKIEEKPTIH